MVTRHSRAGRQSDVDTDPGLEALSRALAEREQAPAGPAQAEGAAEVELTMAELIGDDQGEIVFFNDSGFRSLGLTTDAAVTASGRAQRHLTAGGADVTGFKFVTFDTGLTLYYDSAIELILRRRDPPG